MRGVLEAVDHTGPVKERPAAVRLSPDPASVADLLHDESRMSAAAVASVAVPQTLSELRHVLRWHAECGHTVCVSGARTGVTGGAVPHESSHLVSTAALQGILDLDAGDDGTRVTVQAGTTLRDLHTALERVAPGWTLPLDPTEASASLGGMVATNAAGARSYRFGSTRAWVEGLTVELASGCTLSLRRGADRADGDRATLVDGHDTRTVHLARIPKPRTKNAIGYAFEPSGDLLDLFIGSEGTLGVVSTVTLRLAHLAENRLTFLQCFGQPAAAFAFVDAVRRDGQLRTTALEFLDPRSHELARDTGKPEVARVLSLAPPDSCSIFAEFGYDDDAALGVAIDRVQHHVAAAGGTEDAGLAGIDEQALRDIRIFRHAVPERINATIATRREAHPTLHKVATDMAVEDQDLQWVYDLYATRLTKAGLDHAIFGHAGNNHFHVNILPRDDYELRLAKGIYAEFATAIVARGGCVSAEHGIGRIKKHFLGVQYGDDAMNAMRAAKRWLDPRWRLNPGILLDP